MLGLLVIIVISWGLLYLIEKKHITVLGIVPNPKHLTQFLIGFVFIIVLNLLWVFIETTIKSVVWETKSINYGLIYHSFIYHLRSALTEDLVFRGAILYLLIQKIGPRKAIVISAVIFGIYHVFSYGMTSDRVIPIIYVILTTGFTGYVWAYAFDKTKSIAIGLGFHLGYNLLMTCFYPSQPYGELLFTQVSRVNFSEWNELYFALLKGFFPSIITLFFIRILLKSDFKIFKIK